MTHELESFGWVLLATGAVVAAALVFHPVSERVRVPAPAFFLFAAIAVSELVPPLPAVPLDITQQLVTVALVFILLDGGVSLGWRRLRPSLAAASWMGLAGTVLIAGATGALAHLLLGFSWHAALLLGIALAPTDPAAVFSALGRKEVRGRSGTLLNGEAGLNDPAGVALLAGVLELGGRTGSAAVGHVALVFAVQLAVGAATGVAGGLGLRWLLRRVRLPEGGLYSLAVLAGALVVYGVATVAHGSGFLAVFATGVLLADSDLPFERAIGRFHGALASLGELVAFTALGLTVTLADFEGVGTVVDGVLMAVVTLVLVRPAVMLPMLLPVRVRRGERVFLALAGLKGAVPILLGSFLVTGHAAHGRDTYAIVFVVVAVSILGQGTLIPWLARRCGIRLHARALRPWPLGVRFRSPPTGVRRYRVQPGAAAEDTGVTDLALPDDVWVSLVIRDGVLLSLSPGTRLRAGDEVVLVTDPRSGAPDQAAREVFGPG